MLNPQRDRCTKGRQLSDLCEIEKLTPPPTSAVSYRIDMGDYVLPAQGAIVIVQNESIWCNEIQ